MEPTPIAILDPDVALDFSPFLLIHKDGRVQRLLGSNSPVPPTSDDPSAAVLSKDIPISSSPAASARLYLPTHKTTKLPLLIYFHGGGFAIESAMSPTYHHYLSRLAVETSSVILSVDYRLAPEHPLPAAYDDSWAGVLLAASLSDPWLSDHADPSRLFFAGDSAGANIAHHMAARFGADPPEGLDLVGVALVHPFFMCSDNGEAELDPKRAAEKEFAARFWEFLCPGGGVDHPWMNPVAEGKLGALGGSKVAVLVAEEDFLRERGVWYAEELGKSGWPGKVELVETKGEGHCFHLINAPNSNSEELMRKMVEFINTT